MAADWMKALRGIGVKLRLEEANEERQDEDDALKQDAAERLVDVANRLFRLEAEISVMRRSS